VTEASDPSISVVVPLYNKAAYIERTLRSVLAQDCRDFEVLVVDDGSTDGGGGKAEALGDPRIRVVRFPNAGVSAARNRGAALARASLVAFLDADDVWEPTFLKTVSEALAAEPRAVAAFSAFVDGLSGRSRMPRFSGTLLIEDYPGWFVSHGGRGLWSSNTIVRASALRASGGFPEGVQNGEDTDTWFRLSFTGPVLYVPEPLVRYVEEDSESLSRQGASEPVVIATLSRALEAGTIPVPARRSARVAIHYFRAAYATALAQQGDRGAALRELSRTSLSLGLLRTYARALAALVSGR
jgi:glycosyltransferase involved in cell wall biosynthesis